MLLSLRFVYRSATILTFEKILVMLQHKTISKNDEMRDVCRVVYKIADDLCRFFPRVNL